MPTIAIPPCSKLADYEAAVRRVGGTPWILDLAEDRPAEVVRAADGLLLPGGGDVNPSIYGEAAHPSFTAAEQGRDAYEIELVRRALEADLPTFAICRGVQVLNVARGGTLIQDIPSEMPVTVQHRLAAPPHESFALAHEIWIETGSLLARLAREQVSGDSCQVNSRHHQAAKTLGEGLQATATAPDGVVEALEDPARRFCLGVQWHPENFYRTGEFSSLFEAFVLASKA